MKKKPAPQPPTVPTVTIPLAEWETAMATILKYERALVEVYHLTSNEYSKVGGLIHKVFNCSRLEMAEKKR